MSRPDPPHHLSLRPFFSTLSPPLDNDDNLPIRPTTPQHLLHTLEHDLVAAFERIVAPDTPLSIASTPIIISKSQGQNALLLQVILVDPGEAAHEHGAAAEVAELERGVFAGGAFAEVRVANEEPGDVGVAVAGGEGWDWNGSR